jgi:hypothetical protein
MTYRAPHFGTAFINYKSTVWDYMATICRAHECWIYINLAQRAKDERMAYELFFDHYLGPNNVGNMASVAETKLAITLYNGEKKIFTWDAYVWIHMEHHTVFNDLKEYGYSRIDDSSKVRILMKGIKATELDVCKAKIMASPTLCDNFTATVELYFTRIKQMKAENPQMNVSEVNYSKNRQIGKT